MDVGKAARTTPLKGDSIAWLIASSTDFGVKVQRIGRFENIDRVVRAFDERYFNQVRTNETLGRFFARRLAAPSTSPQRQWRLRPCATAENHARQILVERLSLVYKHLQVQELWQILRGGYSAQTEQLRTGFRSSAGAGRDCNDLVRNSLIQAGLGRKAANLSDF